MRVYFTIKKRRRILKKNFKEEEEEEGKSQQKKKKKSVRFERERESGLFVCLFCRGSSFPSRE